MATKKKSSSADGVSLSEFRAWLSGIEEMQGPDWAPNLDQWKRIKAKFAEIVEEEDVRPQFNQARAPAGQQPFVPVQPYVAPAGAPRQPLPSGLQSGNNGQTKTPDIDSSAGYVSSLV